LERGIGGRKWGKLALLLSLGVVIGSAQALLLRHLYGIPSAQAFITIALLLAICDFLFAWNVERTTRREGPELWNSIVGRQGAVLSAPGGPRGEAGTVRVGGEIWKARCRLATRVLPGQKVVVTGRDGLVLEVEPLLSDREQSADPPGSQERPG